MASYCVDIIFQQESIGIILETHHSQFKKACTYTKGETIYVFNGKHKDLPDLPSMNGYESFRKKVILFW